MERMRERIYLASLLHDIGKFYQRADTGDIQHSRYLKGKCQEEASFCPSRKGGGYSHKHVLWTAQFIDDFSAVFQHLLQEDSEVSSPNGTNLIDLAARHHLPENQLTNEEKIIKEADSLSAGMNRDSEEAFRDAEDELNPDWDVFKRKRLASILQTIDINKGSASEKTQPMYLPAGRLHLSQNLFPQKDDSSVPPDYAQLWDEFKKEFESIHSDTYVAFAETLLSLLFKYTAYIPASTANLPDVSLYDHLKTTAALAVCLYDFQQSKGNENEPPFLLIGADFSGIQPYIYQIVSKYAGKNLKGRSFYLRLLSDAVVRYLLKELHLFQANVVYNSGGGFYLLAPNTTSTKKQLQKAIRLIEQHLFEAHATALYVAIDSVPLSKDALMHRNGNDLGKVWGELFVKRDRKKMAKFAEQIEANYQAFFEPILQGGEARRDTITGEEFTCQETVVKKESLLLKPVTAQQIELGQKLREADIIVVKEGDPLSFWEDKTPIAPANLGFTYYFLNEADLKEKKDRLDKETDRVTILTLNGKEGNCDFLHAMKDIHNIYGLEFYGGNEIDFRHLKTFEEMCANENLSRLGVLRMDVDNLGNIFQQGIPAHQATLSRFAALSRSFDFFFSGYLNTIWRETAPDRSFIVYSGGDDVFIVGSWDATIQLAQRIRNDFRKYTCGNPSFSLSGGIAIVQPKFPIMKGAEESEQEEQRAKSHGVTLSNGKFVEKNALSFMDMPLNWDHEYPAMEALKNELCSLLKEDEVLPKSFLSKVMQHYADSGMKNHCITRLKTYWMLTYDLSRMKERSNNDSVKTLIDACIKDVFNKDNKTLNGRPLETNYHALELWNFASRWAELEYRSNK